MHTDHAVFLEAGLLRQAATGLRERTGTSGAKQSGADQPLKEQMYLSNVVFSTGIADAGDHYVVASGEVDLACRITFLPKTMFTV